MEKRNRRPATGAKMPPRLRKLVLTLHIVIAVGWIGLEVGLLALGLTGLTTGDPNTLRAAYVAMGLFGSIFLAPLSFGTLATGLVLGLGTPWGLVQHWWVLIKLVITVALTAGGMLSINGMLQAAAANAMSVPIDTLTAAAIGGVRFQVVGATTVGSILLIVATALSVYKPWGKTWFARRSAVGL